MNLSIFNNNLFEAGTEFFSQLGIRLNSNTSVSLGAKDILKDHYKDKDIFKAITETYFLGLVDDSVFDGNTPLLNKEKISLKEASEKINAEYNGLMVFAVKLNDSYSPARGDIAELTRAFNRASKNVPVVLLLKYGGLVSFAASERTKYKQAWREGEKIGKISLLKDINLKSPHAGHLKILDDLKVAPAVADFNALYKQWQKVFNVQLLNKKFYQELANWYFWALKNVEFPEDAEKNKDVRNAISVIRMITRLIFIWFIKEKGLVHDDLFNQAKLKSLLNFSDKNQSTYYKAILQNLFFATLNTEMNKDKLGSRKFRGKRQEGRDQHYMIHNVFRYEDYFTSPQDTLKKYFEDIPFLNGGLFECLDKDISPTLAKGGEGGFSNKKIIRIDGFSDHPKNSLKVPDYLFFSPEQSVDLNEIYGTKNKTYKIRGLIDILDSYKFTVDENTPIEEEIALDPELLGKVFENLLASYNPETQTTARKQTGSFYTPREIVNYMVDESIIAYLTIALERHSRVPVCHSREGGNPEELDSRLKTSGMTENKNNESHLRHLVAYNDDLHKFTPAEVDILIAAINTLNALDPACGSGAFPMGMLHKLVYILGKLDPDNSKWRDLQRQKAIKETEEAYKNEDKEEREKRLLDISEVFENNASDYGRKLYLIENCIFGVDIQPIAVQIAKLRFFVSLIVDQRIDPKKENLGIRPLPNLETKFVAANTLIGIERPAQGLLRNREIDRKEAELKQVRERHFTARTPKTKQKCIEDDKKLRAEISELLKKDGFPAGVTEKLANWNPYDQNASADFFDPEWMFGITEGFDVVLGNPPYVQLQKLRGHPLQKVYKDQNYKIHDNNGDLYCLFYEKGIQTLKEKGTLCLITSNKWLRAEYGQKLRGYFAEYNPLILIDLGPGVFESATVDTNILLIQKSDNHHLLQAVSIKDKGSVDLASMLKDNAVTLANVGKGAWFLGSEAEQKLKEKIEKIGKPLKEWNVRINFGIKTGLNEAYIIDQATRDKLVAKDLKSAEILKPILRGRDIKRYGYKWAGLWIIATFPAFKINIDNYPAIKKFLLDFGKERLEQEGNKLPDGTTSRKKTGNKWFETQDQIAYYPELEKKKVVWKRIGSVLRFGYDSEGMYAQDSTCIMTGNNLKYICAFMNSQLGNSLLFDKAPKTGTGDVIVSVQALDPLLIPPITKENKHIVVRIETLVDQILAAKKKDPNADTSALEREIDKIVYALYGLTPEEIAIVEED